MTFCPLFLQHNLRLHCHSKVDAVGHKWYFLSPSPHSFLGHIDQRWINASGGVVRSAAHAIPAGRARMRLLQKRKTVERNLSHPASFPPGSLHSPPLRSWYREASARRGSLWRLLSVVLRKRDLCTLHTPASSSPLGPFSVFAREKRCTQGACSIPWGLGRVFAVQKCEVRRENAANNRQQPRFERKKANRSEGNTSAPDESLCAEIPLQRNGDAEHDRTAMHSSREGSLRAVAVVRPITAGWRGPQEHIEPNEGVPCACGGQQKCPCFLEKGREVFTA